VNRLHLEAHDPLRLQPTNDNFYVPFGMVKSHAAVEDISRHDYQS